MSEENDNNDNSNNENGGPPAFKKLERFGRYLIMDHLVDGGMAKICRARFLGEKADKIVAIKMVQPQFSKDESFKTMFMDEIRVCFGLIHPNIAQTYDYGLINEQLYTAMEYVDGANLKQFLDKLNEKKYVFPVEISVYITSQICQGLHYAHNFTDKLTNKALNMVHRDISPHNIMVTFDGGIKVIDFGIAKAETNSESTQAGTIKGKLSYLAPEYLEGLKLDHRYDQFATGITLWELLCSRKLFTAANDLAVLKKIQVCKIPPPSSINPNVPKELDQIVLKALSKDRNLRYEDMDQFNRALNKFLYAKYPDFNSSDLKYFAHELFKEKIEADKVKMQEFGKIDIAPYLAEMQNEKSSGGGSEILGETKGLSKRVEIDLGFDTDKSGAGAKGLLKSPASGINLDTGDTKKRRSGATQVAFKLPTNGLGATSKTPVEKTEKAASVTPTPAVKTPEKKGATVTPIKSDKASKTNGSIQKRAIEAENDDQNDNVQDSGSKKKLMIRIAAGIAVIGIVGHQFLATKPAAKVSVGEEVALDDSGSHVKRLPSSKGNKAPAVVEKAIVQGKVLLNNFDANSMKLFVNDDEVEYSTVKGVVVDLDKEYVIRVDQKGKNPYFEKVLLRNDNREKSLEVPEMDRVAIGLLTTSNNYENSTLTIAVNGNSMKIKLPVQQLELPVGTYSGTLFNGNLNSEKIIDFQITEDKKTIIE